MRIAFSARLIFRYLLRICKAIWKRGCRQEVATFSPVAEKKGFRYVSYQWFGMTGGENILPSVVAERSHYNNDIFLAQYEFHDLAAAVSFKAVKCDE